MLTKCSYCGEHSRIQQEGNACHTCMKGIMIRNEGEEKNILRSSVWVFHSFRSPINPTELVRK